MKKVRAEFKLVHEDAVLPRKKRPEDAAYDCFSIDEGVILPITRAVTFFHWLKSLFTSKTLEPGYKVFRTGVRLSVPPGYFVSVRGRSGLGFNGVQPFIGTLDSTFNGKLLIMLLNHGIKPYKVNKGDRIAQIVIEEQIDLELVEVEEFSPRYSKRGQAGLGSSGK